METARGCALDGDLEKAFREAGTDPEKAEVFRKLLR
jgi:hypothetical protein